MDVGADVIIIGGGIAGVSLAASLAPLRRVIVIEGESALGYHATGRSAAMFLGSYGNAVVRALSTRSLPFFRRPPTGFTETTLMVDRDLLVIASAETCAAFEKLINEATTLYECDLAYALKRVPILRPELVVACALDQVCGDLDVNGLLFGYRARARAAGAEFHLNTPVEALTCGSGVWKVYAADKCYQAPVVVNAAGAWVDEIAKMASVTPLGFAPLRRAAAVVDAPEGMDVSHWPLVLDAAERFYFKPEIQKLLVSPANETPDSPCDTVPDELDIAEAMDRFMTATSMNVQRLSSSWAGLRTFAPDRTPVVGYDEAAPGFFWLAGQGGYGVQTAPAVSMLATNLLLERPVEYEDRELVAALSPARFSEG